MLCAVGEQESRSGQLHGDIVRTDCGPGLSSVVVAGRPDLRRIGATSGLENCIRIPFLTGADGLSLWYLVSVPFSLASGGRIVVGGGRRVRQRRRRRRSHLPGAHGPVCEGPRRYRDQVRLPIASSCSLVF